MIITITDTLVVCLLSSQSMSNFMSQFESCFHSFWLSTAAGPVAVSCVSCLPPVTIDKEEIHRFGGLARRHAGESLVGTDAAGAELGLAAASYSDC